MNKKQKSGFTLAEVLITLAIIGVVAALTLPTMIANHQKKVYVVQLQKAISTLEQGFKMMMADDAVDKLQYTSVFQLCNSYGYYPCEYGSDDTDTQVLESWKKYFNISQIGPISGSYDWKALSTSKVVDDYSEDGLGDDFLQFADGMFVTFGLLLLEPWTVSSSSLVKDPTLTLGLIYIDVNGLKGPNTYGRDQFEFYLQPDGILVGWGAGTKEKCNCSNCTGEACTSYLMTNGWVMDY